MNDAVEQELLERMAMSDVEKKLFELSVKKPEDEVIPALRERKHCYTCFQPCNNEKIRLWHQFVHVESYEGFLEGKTDGDVPDFDYYIECPHSTCSEKYEDFIDAKIHYLMAHKRCDMFCCGNQFRSYSEVLRHLEQYPGHRNSLQPYYICICCNKVHGSREEHIKHLQGRIHKCPDPVCKAFYPTNERALRHFFERHYRHLAMDHRMLLLSFRHFQRYEEKREERCNGAFQCYGCHRRFYHFEGVQHHVNSKMCLNNDQKLFIPAVYCTCNYQFVYCYHQRDLLLRNLPILKEAMEHVEREAPYNRMPEDVIKIYRTIRRVLTDVNNRLNSEKYSNYYRTSSAKHSKPTPKQITIILLKTIDYFVKIM